MLKRVDPVRVGLTPPKPGREAASWVDASILPLTLIIIGLAVGAFVWGARKGQFDDLTTPAMRVLHDDDEKREEKSRDS